MCLTCIYWLTNQPLAPNNWKIKSTGTNAKMALEVSENKQTTLTSLINKFF